MSIGRPGAGLPVRHHPSAATLLCHAAHSLGEASALVVGAHLACCPACRRTVALAEATGGLLLDSLPPTPLAPGALAGALARLDAPAPAPSLPRQASDRLGTLLRRVRPRWVAPGLRHALLLREAVPGGAALRLLRVSPGTALPRHDHSGVELTLVLEGRFVDDADSYGPGDVAEADEGFAHRPVAEGPGDCVCLLATEGRLRFESPLARLLGWLGRV